MQLAIRSGDYYMFDDLDDDDVTDLLPDTESERKKRKLPHEKDHLGRRMTVSEVRKIEKKKNMFFGSLNVFIFQGYELECVMKLNDEVSFTNPPN